MGIFHPIVIKGEYYCTLSNVFSVVPLSKIKDVSKMLKTIHDQESKDVSHKMAKAVVQSLQEMKLEKAAKKVEKNIEDTLSYADFPFEHWTCIHTNNVIERLNHEIPRSLYWYNF